MRGMFSTYAVHNRQCNTVQYDNSLITIHYQFTWNDKDLALQRRYVDFLIPLQIADLVYATAGVDCKLCVIRKVGWQFLE